MSKWATLAVGALAIIGALYLVLIGIFTVLPSGLHSCVQYDLASVPSSTGRFAVELSNQACKSAKEWETRVLPFRLDD